MVADADGKLPVMDEARELAQSLRPLVRDRRVLAAIAAVPRHLFVPEGLRERAYENLPLPIGRGQTISQPLIVARMLELLELGDGDRVLDVGTGSGWHAALLAELAGHVWTVERLPVLSRRAETALRAAGYGPERVTVLAGDGTRGLPDEAPFDAINVAAAAWPVVPEALERQLAPGGRLVAPVGASGQQLVLERRSDDGAELERTPLEAVRFVPLIEGD